MQQPSTLPAPAHGPWLPSCRVNHHITFIRFILLSLIHSLESLPHSLVIDVLNWLFRQHSWYLTRGMAEAICIVTSNLELFFSIITTQDSDTSLYEGDSAWGRIRKGSAHTTLLCKGFCDPSEDMSDMLCVMPVWLCVSCLQVLLSHWGEALVTLARLGTLRPKQYYQLCYIDFSTVSVRLDILYCGLGLEDPMFFLAQQSNASRLNHLTSVHHSQGLRIISE